MPEKDLYELIAKAQTHGGNNYFAQFSNANQGLQALNGAGLDTQSQQYQKAASGLKAQKGQAAAGSALAILGGATDILNNTFNAAQTADTSQQQGMIEDMSRIGSGDYNSFNQLASDYDSLNSIQPDLSYDAIRGGSTGERVGNVFSSTLSGATTGLTVGGPWGALAGAVVGLGSGIGGWLAGDAKAREEKRRLEIQARQAQNTATRNLAAANEGLMNTQFRAGVGNRSAQGGKIERKQETIQEFAARALKRPRQRDFVSSGRIARRHGEGGTIIRIKR